MAAPTIRKTTELIEQIIPCALARFVKYGYKKTTVDEIASDVRISKKTLYEVFPSKEEILRETMWRETRNVIRDFEKTIPAHAKADEMLLSLCRVIFTTRIRHGENGMFWGLYSSDPYIREAAGDSMKRIFGAIFEEGRRQGLFKQISADFAGDVILNMLDAAESLYVGSKDPLKMFNDTLSIIADAIAYKNRLSFNTIV